MSTSRLGAVTPRRGGLALTAALVVVFGAGCTDDPPSAAPDVASSPGGAAGSEPGSSPGPSAGAAPMPASHELAGNWDLSKQPDPCRTIKQSEVTKVLGVKVTRSSQMDSWPPLCAFGLPGPTVEYLYVMDDSKDSGRVDFDNERTNAAAVQPVSGVGDEAYWIPDKTELNVIKGRTHVVAKFGGSAPPDRAKEKAIAVARIVLPRAKPAPVPPLGPAVPSSSTGKP